MYALVFQKDNFVKLIDISGLQPKGLQKILYKNNDNYSKLFGMNV